MSKILIIGKTPPPTGRVTIHTSRLLDYFNVEKVEYTFYNNHKFNIFSFVSSIWKAKKAHIHLYNKFFLFVFTILYRVLNTYYIITIHGNIYSYGSVMSFFE